LLETKPTPAWRLLAVWGLGVLALAALVVVVLRLGELERFLDLARSARPQWLVLALGAQVSTEICAAGVWQRVLRKSDTALSPLSLFPLGVAKVFTDQALPTGGLSGTLLVFRGLLRRRVASDVAVTALMVGMVSYYSAYLIAVLTAFAILCAGGQCRSDAKLRGNGVRAGGRRRSGNGSGRSPIRPQSGTGSAQAHPGRRGTG
jgi:uncharacterized membrane protein YbhN (UPF0104 family)